MAHGDAREGKWRGNWRMEWVASTLYTISEHGVSRITTADTHTPTTSSRLNWHPCRFKWTRPFRQKTISGYCACAITFQTQSTKLDITTVGCEVDGTDSDRVLWLALVLVVLNLQALLPDFVSWQEFLGVQLTFRTLEPRSYSCWAIPLNL